MARRKAGGKSGRVAVADSVRAPQTLTDEFLGGPPVNALRRDGRYMSKIAARYIFWARADTHVLPCRPRPADWASARTAAPSGAPDAACLAASSIVEARRAKCRMLEPTTAPVLPASASNSDPASRWDSGCLIGMCARARRITILKPRCRRERGLEN